MELSDAVRLRRMTRTFQPHELDGLQLERLLGAVERAPSAGGTSGWRTDVFVGADEVATFWSAAWPTPREGESEEARSGRMAASAVIVAGIDSSAYRHRYAQPDKEGAAPDRWPVDFAVVDASFAAMLVQLVAVDQGLGAWFFGFDARSYRSAFSVPEDVVLIGAVAVGMPTVDRPPSRSRTAGERRRPAKGL